jgi:hypothetical protein
MPKCPLVPPEACCEVFWGAGGKPDDTLLRLAAGASGNPLYVTELFAALARGSSITITDAGRIPGRGGEAGRRWHPMIP